MAAAGMRPDVRIAFAARVGYEASVTAYTDNALSVLIFWGHISDTKLSAAIGLFD